MQISQLESLLNDEETEIWLDNWAVFDQLDDIETPVRFTRNIQDEDIALLENNKQIRTATKNELEEKLNYVKVFSIPETTKRRRRFIVEPEEINLAFPLDTHVHLKTPKEVIDQLLEPGATHAILFDYAAWFQQFRLPAPAQKHYAFRHRFKSGEVKTFLIETLPMGQRQSVPLAQVASEALARSSADVQPVIFIDNTRFVGSAAACIEAGTALKEKAEAVGATTNEDIADIAALVKTKYDFLGMKFDHENRTVGISDKTKEKLIEAAKEVDSELSIERAMGVIALLLWARQVNGEEMAQIYYIMKFLRKRSQAVGQGRASFKDPANIWPCIRESLKHELLRAAHFGMRSIRKGGEDITLVTDACERGWAGCLFSGNQDPTVIAADWASAQADNCHALDLRAPQFSVAAGAFHPQLQGHINEKEIRAVLYSLKQFDLRDVTMKLWIDNTTGMNVLKKGASRSYHLNEVCRLIHDELKARNIVLKEVRYVPSAQNIADGPSRAGFENGLSMV